MNRSCIILLLSLALGKMAWSQAENLVFNPSFEDYLECPRKIDAKGVLTIVEAWYQPTAGSADYFNLCASRECAVPKNKLGYQLPRTGAAYCGIYCSKNDYREYLQTQLKRPLKAGYRYRVEFHVSLSENSTAAVSTIGALFTKERIEDSGRAILMRKSTQQTNSLVNQTISTYYTPQAVSSQPLTDTAHWMEVSGEFVANGGEEFMTIGNFYDAAHSTITEMDGLTQILSGSYYYIDDVSVIELESGQTEEVKEPEKNSSPEELAVGSTVVLHDIYFQFDRSVILQQSYKELIDLFNLLQNNPRMKIEIGGHTDDKGSTEYNRKLSENRAKAVADYLTAKGIDAKRLNYRGYGKERPIADNSTEEGRAKNRRVEIKVLSK